MFTRFCSICSPLLLAATTFVNCCPMLKLFWFKAHGTQYIFTIQAHVVFIFITSLVSKLVAT